MKYPTNEEIAKMAQNFYERKIIRSALEIKGFNFGAQRVVEILKKQEEESIKPKK